MLRIFILSGPTLFSWGVEILLSRVNNIEFVGHETNVDQAIERIRQLGPDVVLLEQGPGEMDPGPVVMRILRETQGTKIVGLNLSDNTIRVYRGEQIIARKIDDLIQAIVTL